MSAPTILENFQCLGGFGSYDWWLGKVSTQQRLWFGWTAQSGAVVQVESSTLATGPFVACGNTAVGASDINFFNGNYGTSKYYRARAFNNDGNGPWTTPILVANASTSAALSITNLTVHSNDGAEVILRFQAQKTPLVAAVVLMTLPGTNEYISNTVNNRAGQNAMITPVVDGGVLYGQISFRPAGNSLLHSVRLLLRKDISFAGTTVPNTGAFSEAVTFTSTADTFGISSVSTTTNLVVGLDGDWDAFESNRSADWAISGGTGLPPGLSIDAGPATSTQITGTPTTAGSYTFAVAATYGSVTKYIARTMTVVPVAMRVTSAASAKARINSAFSYTITAAANDGAGIADTFEATGLPPWASLSGSTGTITGTPLSAGVWTVNVTAYQDARSGVTGTLRLVITAAGLDITNESMSLSVAPGARTATTLLSNGGTVVSWEMVSGPSWATVRNAGSVWQLVLAPVEFGQAEVSVRAYTASDEAVESFTVNVVPTDVPVVDTAQGVLGYNVNEYFEFQPAATNFPSNWSAVGLPAGVTINADTGLISGYSAVKGQYNVLVRSSNVVGVSAPVTFFIGIDDTTAMDPPIVPPVEGTFLTGIILPLYIDLVTKRCSASSPAATETVAVDEPILFLKEGDTFLLAPRFYRRSGTTVQWPAMPTLTDVRFALKNDESEAVLVESGTPFLYSATWILPVVVTEGALADAFVDGTPGAEISKRMAAFVGVGEISWEYDITQGEGMTILNSTRAFGVSVERDIVP
jgi:hypothetical protein